jgi:peroxiredoxin
MRRTTCQAVAALGLFAAMLAPAPAAAVGVGEKAPDFSLATLDGGAVRLDELRGDNPVMIVFWATWCPICRQEVPKVNQTLAQFGARGLKVLGVNVGINDSARKAVAYQAKYGVEYPLAFDEGSRVSQTYGVNGTPTVIIVDRRGVVRYRAAEVPDDLGEHFDQLMR